MGLEGNEGWLKGAPDSDAGYGDYYGDGSWMCRCLEEEGEAGAAVWKTCQCMHRVRLDEERLQCPHAEAKPDDLAVPFAP